MAISIGNFIGNKSKIKLDIPDVPDIPNHPNIVCRYSTIGKTNRDVDRTILKDLSNNGYNLELKDFTFGLDPTRYFNGYGGFVQDFSKMTNINESNNITVVSKKGYSVLFNNHYSNAAPINTIKKEDFVNAETWYSFESSNADSILQLYAMDTNGVSHLIGELFVGGGYMEPLSDEIFNKTLYIYDVIYSVELNQGDFYEIMQHVDYEESCLVFDGKCYAISENTPILTDYTYIAKFKVLEDRYDKFIFAKSNNFEIGKSAFGYTLNKIYSFGSSTLVGMVGGAILEGIAHQTKSRFNDKPILSGSVIDGKELTIGTLTKAEGTCTSMLLYDFILYNRTLSLLEINEEIKKYKL